MAATFSWTFPQTFDNGGLIQLNLDSARYDTAEAIIELQLRIVEPFATLELGLDDVSNETKSAVVQAVTYNFEAFQRLQSNIKSPYDATAPTWSSLLTAFAAEFGELQTARREVNDNKFVTTATDGSLDKIATLFNVERRTGETDEQTRLAIQTALRAQITSATIGELTDVIAFLLDIDAEEIEIQESSSTSPRINVLIDPEKFENRTSENFTREIQPLTAAGVLAVGLIPGTFRFTSEDDTVESDIGFAELDEETNEPVPDTGGTWPALLSG